MVDAPREEVEKMDEKRRADYQEWKRATAEFLRHNPSGWATATPVGLDERPEIS